MDSRTRNSTVEGEQDLDFYIKHQIPVEQIRTILKHKKMGDDKVDNLIQKVEDARSRINKYARKFIEKMDQRYGMSDIPSIINKAAKFAAKHELSSAERDAIISLAMKGDVYDTYSLVNELKYSEMSKFMGIESSAGQVLNLQSKDYATLNEIIKLFEQSRIIHMDIKNQLALYRDCAVEALTGGYDRTKHNISIHIHPVVVALFLPKINVLEHRMLYSNIGRIVLQRAQPYINRHIALTDNVLPMEFESEWQLTVDIANDPNSLAYFSDDTPVSNMLKRFKIQIELWKNVLNLRHGKFYSYGSYETDDGITGFLRILSSYDWSYFDSPDMYHIQDEGTVLRKLLAVFSLRPTFAQVSTINNRSFLGYNSYSGYAKTQFLRIPIINVRLPSVNTPNAPPTMHLSRALNQADFFIENRNLVPKTKAIIFSRDVVFFYANRRFQALNVANISLKFSYTALPYQSWNAGQTSINEMTIEFDPVIKIGNDDFTIRSVVTVYRPPIGQTLSVGAAGAVGSSCVVIKYGGAQEQYFYYNPLLASVMFEDADASGNRTYAANPPISEISNADADELSFQEMAQKYGTIFTYTNLNA